MTAAAETVAEPVAEPAAEPDTGPHTGPQTFYDLVGGRRDRRQRRLDLLTPTDLSTGCPYKGTAQFWSLTGAGPGVPANIAGSYPDPLPAVHRIRGLIAFYDEAVDITVDGELRERPVTPLTKTLQPSD